MVTQKKGVFPMARADEKPITGRFGAILSSLGPTNKTKKEITDMLKGYGNDFDSSKVEGRLNVPQREFRKIEKGTGATYYVYPEIGNLEQVVDSLARTEKIAPAGVEYAVVFVGKSNSVDIVVVDSTRKVVIRRRVYALGSDAYENIWEKVGADLEKALKSATSEQYGFVIEGRTI